MTEQLTIAVCGPGEPTPEERDWAFQIGAEVGRAGVRLACGGLGGAMEAAARGALEAGGTTIGILPGLDTGTANPWITHPIATGMGQARNVILVASADAVIACGGGWGTLSEIALAVRMGRPVVILGTWSGIRELAARHANTATSLDAIVTTTDPVEAVAQAMALARRFRSRH